MADVTATPVAVKPGFKTSEFFLTLLTTIGTVGASLAGVLSGKAAAIVAGISTAAYAISRGLAKS